MSVGLNLFFLGCEFIFDDGGGWLTRRIPQGDYIVEK